MTARARRDARVRFETLRYSKTLALRREVGLVLSFPVGPIVVFYQLVADGREAQILGIIDGLGI